MIPKVRLKYVQGLASVRSDLRLPRDLELSTDGQQLVISTAGAGRPLVKIPLTAVERIETEPDCGPATPTNRAAAGLAGDERVIVLQFRAQPGVPEAVGGEPIVLADPYEGDVTPRFHTLNDVLVPRTDAEMAVLAKGERRLARTYAIAFVLIVLLVIFIIAAIQQLVAGPKPKDALLPGRAVLASASIVIGGEN